MLASDNHSTAPSFQSTWPSRRSTAFASTSRHLPFSSSMFPQAWVLVEPAFDFEPTRRLLQNMLPLRHRGHLPAVTAFGSLLGDEPSSSSHQSWSSELLRLPAPDVPLLGAPSLIWSNNNRRVVWRGHARRHRSMSAFGGKTDIRWKRFKCPLMTQSGHHFRASSLEIGGACRDGAYVNPGERSASREF